MYVRFIEWDYGLGNDSYEKCFIAPASQEDIDNDGFNFIGRAGDQGAELKVFKSLKKAILSSSFNPFKINYSELSEEELKEKDKILSKIIWDSKDGVKLK